MKPLHNVIADARFTSVKPNNNNNVSTMSRAYTVDSMIDKLQIGLKARDESRPFLAKVCWKLPESSVWSNYEKALKGSNPMGLFIWLCKKEGV